MSPDDFTSDESFDSLIHVTVNSMFFGFLDDLYIEAQTYPLSEKNPKRLQLRLQSQLRMGSSDFM